MPEPVKLSRERWDMLTREWPMTWANPLFPNRRVVREPIERDGVVFLPAEYELDAMDWLSKRFASTMLPCA